MATGRPRSDPDAHSVALLRRALDHVPSGHDVTRSRLLSALADAEFFRGEASRAEQLSGEALQLARASGDLAEGKRLAEAALRQGLWAGSQDALMYHLTQMIEVWEGGSERELIEERLGNPRLWPQTPARLPMLAYLQAWLGRLDSNQD